MLESKQGVRGGRGGGGEGGVVGAGDLVLKKQRAGHKCYAMVESA